MDSQTAMIDFLLLIDKVTLIENVHHVFSSIQDCNPALTWGVQTIPITAGVASDSRGTKMGGFQIQVPAEHASR